MRTIVLATLTSLLCIGAANALEGDPAAGKGKSAICAACHGADGNSINPLWPNLAGQHPAYMAKQLADIKNGKTRTNAIMAPILAMLSEQGMADVSAYFSTQKPKPGKANPETLEAGAKIYRGGIKVTGVPACAACHGPTGRGNAPAGFPSLASQNPAYTVNQMKAFRSGARKNDYQGMMRDITRYMADDEIQAVADYIAGLY